MICPYLLPCEIEPREEEHVFICVWNHWPEILGHEQERMWAPDEHTNSWTSVERSLLSRSENHIVFVFEE
jgi:hypothetical protein